MNDPVHAPPFPLPRRRLLALGAAALAGSAGVGRAEIRMPGEYRGVVLFDRWDTCILYNGVHLSYVAEAVKERLRPYAGQFVRLDVTEIVQPLDGDVRIVAFTMLEPAAGQPAPAAADGPTLKAAALFDGDGPGVAMEASNPGAGPLTLRARALAPTLFATRDPNPVLAHSYPSDGPSLAVMTRMSFWSMPEDRPRRSSGAFGMGERWFSWRVNGESLPKTFTLAPGRSLRWAITFALPPGEYEFVLGYDGWGRDRRTLVSNAVAFDVTAGASADAAPPSP